MSPLDLKKRNQTAPGGGYEVLMGRGGAPVVALDSMIQRLDAFVTPQLMEYGDIPDHFKPAGFTDADLVLSRAFDTVNASMAWMVEVLRWDPTAQPGAQGAWTWATPTPAITDRLMTALYALSMKPEKADGVFFADAHRRAQLVLNDVLLEHPVLMHPRVRVGIKVDMISPGTCSVAHAIAVSPFAHFPMPSDWPAGRAPTEKLAQWADNVLVRRVLRTALRSIRHEGESPDVRSLSWFALAMKRRQLTAGLLTSLYQFGKLMHPGNEEPAATGAVLDEWKKLHRPEDSIHKAAILAEAILDNAGTSCGAARPIEQAARYREPGFGEYIRALPEDEREKLHFQLRTKVFKHIFLSTPGALSEDDVEHNVRAIIAELTHCGFQPTPGESATWLAAQLKGDGAPPVEAHQALAFLRVLRMDHGIVVTESDVRPFGREQFALAEHMPGWAQALNIESVQRTMAEVFANASTPASSTSPVARRRRASL